MSGKDILSTLPEDLLVHILSFLPTKDVVATMILSKRWRLIWTMVPILTFEETNDENKNIYRFIDMTLQLQRAIVIKSLSIKLKTPLPLDVDIKKWIKTAISRYVCKLKLKLFSYEDPISLPKSLSTSKNLVKLYLSDNILVEVSSPASLPSLKKLKLFNVKYKNDDSVINLLSNSPVLQKLFVIRGENDNVTNFTVNVASLKLFSYENIQTFNRNLEDSGKCLVIDSPLLKTLRIFDYSNDLCKMKNLFELDDACIDTEFRLDDKFIRSFCSVKDLELTITGMSMYCSSIKFSRLVKCKICPWVSNWPQSLIILLQDSPNLKVLVVDCEYVDGEDTILSWNQPSDIPNCLLSYLEIFELIDYRNKKMEKEFLAYILNNSKCLKIATILIGSIFNFEEKQKLVEELTQLHRISTSSQLIVKT